MELITSYSVGFNFIENDKKNKADKEMNKHEAMEATINVYTSAVKYFLNIFDIEWEFMNQVLDKITKEEAMRFMENLTHITKKRPVVKYDFDKKFYKMPSGIRRACINTAFGLIKSYKTNLTKWENSDKSTKRPRFPKVKRCMPVFYKSERQDLGDNVIAIKVFYKNDWVYLKVKLKERDVRYIDKHHADKKQKSLILEKKHNRYCLKYVLGVSEKLSDIKPRKDKILAVDLGINNAATCSVMLSDGTVLDRRFLKLSREKDHMFHDLNKIRKANQNGSKRTPKKWARVNGLNKDIAIKTALFIINTAIENGVNTIVFEHLDLKGKKKGSKKQKLQMWKARYVQKIVKYKAHYNKIHVSHVCAWKTSKLAYDGTGEVTRGSFKVNGKEKYNYSICVFKSGKQYNCDLNATYNIGARYFIREILKSLDENLKLAVLAKVPRCAKRSSCVLSDLISLNAVV